MARWRDGEVARRLADARSLRLADGTAGAAGLQSGGIIHTRTGFDLAAPWQPLESGAVTIDSGGRVELWMGAEVDRGYLLANGTLRVLPAGSTLRGAHFFWVPPLGFRGTYSLVFMRGDELVVVNVRVQ